jgi:membrane protein DedA with SNARE-associated domain
MLAALFGISSKLGYALPAVIGLESMGVPSPGETALLGREVLTAPGPLQARRKAVIAAGDRFFDRHGSRAVFLGRWVALVRVAAAWLAGINKMPFPRFFMWNALGGLTWALTVGLVAYALGNAAAKAINTAGVYAAIAVGVAIVGFLIVHRVRERRAAAAAAAQAADSSASEADADSSSSAQELMQ